MVRYSFLVRLFHPLLHAGLSRRILDHPIRPHQHVRRNRQAGLLRDFQIDDKFFGRECGSLRSSIVLPRSFRFLRYFGFPESIHFFETNSPTRSASSGVS